MSGPLLNWKFVVMGELGGPRAPRVFTASDFQHFVQQFRPGTSAPTARHAAEALVQAGAMRKVGAGLYLNRRARPPAELAEVAHHIRAEAVVSLHSVLGECGFLNNPAAIVVAVVPASRRSNLREVLTSQGGVFRFYGLADKFFPQTESDRWELYQPGRPFNAFRPEAALLQWIYLAGLGRSKMTPPPLDVDMSTLDETLLARLAQRWSLEDALAAWHVHAEVTGFGEEHAPPTPGPHMPAPPSAQKAASARERLKARAKSRSAG